MKQGHILYRTPRHHSLQIYRDFLLIFKAEHFIQSDLPGSESSTHPCRNKLTQTRLVINAVGCCEVLRGVL